MNLYPELWRILLFHCLAGGLFLLAGAYLGNENRNRWIILSILFLPLLFLLDLPVYSPVQESPLFVYMLPEVRMSGVTETPSFNWAWLFVPGLVLPVRYLIGLLHIRYLVRHSRREDIGLYRIYRSEKTDQPFSYFRSVFLPEKLPAEQEYWVLRHEMVHARQAHSLDILLFRLVLSLFWFNPVLWLLEKKLRLTHEYLADAGAIEGNVHRAEYLETLLSSAFGTRCIPGFHAFSKSQLKQRMIHLTQKKTGSRLYAALIPVLFITLLWTACSREREQNPATEGQSAEEALNPGQVDEMPEMEGGMEALMQFLQQEIRYPKELEEQRLSARVMVQFTVMEDGSIKEVKAIKTEGIEPAFIAEAERAVSQMPAWKPGQKDRKAVKVKMILPISFQVK